MTKRSYATVEDQDPGQILQLAYGDLKAGVLDRAESLFHRVGELSSGPRQAEAFNSLGVIAIQRGLYDEALDFFQRAVATSPDNVSARENWVTSLVIKGKQLLEVDRLEEASSTLRSARALALGEEAPSLDHACLSALMHGIADLSNAFQIRRGDLSTALDLLREARPLAWDDTRLRLGIDSLLQITGRPAKLSDYTDRITEPEIGTHMLIACFPKSGSTFLKNVLLEITGFREQPLAYSYGRNYTEMYLPDMLYSVKNDTVTQLHVRPTDSNLNIMQGFMIRPIVLVRNIYDALLSYKEFHDVFYKDLSFYDRYGALDEEQRLDMIVDSRAPWYIEFFAGWQRAIRSGRIDALCLTYEELMRDKVGRAEEILLFHGLERSRQAIAENIDRVSADKAATRFNKGVSGRGQARFNDRHRTQIERLAGYHPDIDFSPIGL